VIGVIALILVLVAPAAAQADPGELDTSFGTNGIVGSSTGTTSSTFDSPTAMAVQPDGKIVVVNSYLNGSAGRTEFLVERYNTDGTLDTSFGSNGIVKSSLGGYAIASSVIVGPSEKILVGGEVDGKLALASFNSDGTLDTSFGSLGVSTTTVSIPENAGFYMEAPSMALLASGKIILGGSYYRNETGPHSETLSNSYMLLARFDEDGALDTSFGTNGMTSGPEGHLFGLATDTSGTIVVSGSSDDEFAVARFTAAGSLDSSFGSGGIVKPALDRYGIGSDVSVLSSGKILVAGSDKGMTVVRLNEDGSTDTSFGGGDGVITPSFSDPCCTTGDAMDVVFDEMGRMVIVGDRSAEDESDPFLNEWTVARLFSDGVPDLTFGDQGLSLNAFKGTAVLNSASSVALQSDGKILVAGSAGYPYGELGLMRYLAGGNAPQPAPDLLKIRNTDPEQGRVLGTDLYCGYNCATDYDPGETVELEAEGIEVHEGTESHVEPFAGWTTISGDPGTCTAKTTPCNLTLNRDTELEARFGTETSGGGEPGGGQSGGGEPGNSSTGTAQPASGSGTPSSSTPASPSPAPTKAQAITACINKAKSGYKAKIKAAKHKSGKAKIKAIKAAAKQKSKRVAACRR